MSRLLVSVRSAEEALKALAGGADIVDVKEPLNGPLGRADFATWREVFGVVRHHAPTSVAMGELRDWMDARPAIPGNVFDGLAFRKIGLAGAGPGWESDWLGLDAETPSRSCRWIAVIYTDWKSAGAPNPLAVLDANIDYAGVLFDTWDKSRPARWNDDLFEAAEAVHRRDGLLAVAGGLTPENLKATAALRPDVIAVRGAACRDGDRMKDLDQRRVAELAEIVRGLPEVARPQPTSKRTPWASGSSAP